MKPFTAYFLISIALLFSLNGLLEAQSMIGLPKEELKVFMKENHRGFRMDNSVVKQRFNYLKYVNGLRTRTWIFYFNEEDICKSSKQVCDYGEFDEMLLELNGSCESAGESRWEYMLEKDTVQVILTRQEWYFTVREARKK
ncbi:MAG: hypothetical protein E4H10_02985 [Bacteroidia bacterium]|nr:MAG: hypothetical protein E4H10_02985 [Bacteroidia bacterium]